MVLTNERAEQLANYLTSDADRAKSLLELEPEEAIEQINADGNDFSVEELKEFGEQVQAAAETQGEGELDADALSNVSGGVLPVAVYVAATGVAVAIGCSVAKKRIW